MTSGRSGSGHTTSRRMRIKAKQTILVFLILQSLATVVHSFSMQMSSSSTMKRATSSSLNKKSTALQVLKTLNNSKRLAPYVTSGTGTAVVTGASKGIGAVCAETLALTGMNIILCVRNVEEGKKVRSSMPSWVQDNVKVQKIDLSDLESIKGAADDIIGTAGGKIDMLVNNAGVMAPLQRMETKQGMEIQFGTNHVGHHYLTRLLLPSFAEDGRVVTVASEAHRTASINFEDINSKTNYSPYGAYGQSKLANVLFAKSLQDELVRNGRGDILSLSLHPGVIATNLWQYTPDIVRPFTSLFADKTVEQGAATSVFAALVPRDEFDGGEYLSDCAEAKPSPTGQDEKGSARSRLWDMTEYMIEEAGFTMPKELV